MITYRSCSQSLAVGKELNDKANYQPNVWGSCQHYMASHTSFSIDCMCRFKQQFIHTYVLLIQMMMMENWSLPIQHMISFWLLTWTNVKLHFICCVTWCGHVICEWRESAVLSSPLRFWPCTYCILKHKLTIHQLSNIY